MSPISSELKIVIAPSLYAMPIQLNMIVIYLKWRFNEVASIRLKSLGLDGDFSEMTRKCFKEFVSIIMSWWRGLDG
jgi:hypothetical protein